MNSTLLSTNFQSMVERMAAEDAAAVVLGWWRRVEKVLAYYCVAWHGKRMPTAAIAENLLKADARVDAAIVNRLQALRRCRNSVAHESAAVLPQDAIAFARDALDVIWAIGETVPNDRALASGAARFA